MKKVLMSAMLILISISLIGFVFANNTDNSIGNSNNEEEENNETILGASCGTVSPGSQNECCVNKGYSGWDEEAWECVGETERERNQEGLLGNSANQEENECEAWKCTKWSNCLRGEKTRVCNKIAFNCTTDDEKPTLKKVCNAKEELKIKGKLRDCPEECVCSGSTIKCTSENGTRTMTVYAGNSGNVIVQINNMNMSASVSLYKDEDGKFYGTFKNNETHEIILPDKLKERIQNRTRLMIQNETMNLTEEGYHIQAQKRARLLGMFPVKEKIEFEIDPATGEITKTKTKWWGFLAKDIEEETEEPETEENVSEEQ